MRIPDQTIDEVRSSNDIVDVVSAFVSLKRRGKNFVGLCPFHREKTPSFTVSTDKQMYHCFGCGKGGNVFTFVMEMEKVSFVEAVRSLAERVGITITEAADNQQRGEIEHLYDACRFAGLQFYKNLTESSEGKAALEYFHKRGFSDETIRLFGLGYSLNSWDGLLKASLEHAISSETLLKAGLLRTREDRSGFYDYFRGRAMFPIFSTSGRAVAFGARRMREDDPVQGKYINSPETPIYSKSRILYGLFQSKDAIRSEGNALMVEGYADLISLFQAGIQNVVASSGTALTEEQVRLVGKYSKTLTLVYDADSAGSQATLRGVDIALEQGMDVRVVPLPQGEDPDSFVRKNGSKEFRNLLNRSVTFIDFKASQFAKENRFATPEGRAEAVRSIVQSLAKIKDELKRTFFLKEVALKYEIYESVLYRELEKLLEKRKPDYRPAIPQPKAADSNGSTEPKPSSGIGDAVPTPERDLLKLLLENNELIHSVFDQISIEELIDPRVREILSLVFEKIRKEGSADVTSFIDELSDPELKSLVSDASLSKYEISKNWSKKEKEIERPDPSRLEKAIIDAIKRREVERRVEEIRQMLNDPNRPSEELTMLRKEWHALSRQLKGSRTSNESHPDTFLTGSSQSN